MNYALITLNLLALKKKKKKKAPSLVKLCFTNLIGFLLWTLFSTSPKIDQTKSNPFYQIVMLDLGITQFSRKIDPVDLPGFELEPVEQRVNLSSKQVFKT